LDKKVHYFFTPAIASAELNYTQILKH